MSTENVEIMSFQDAIKLSASFHGKRHLLLGNGFSIAWNDRIFRYDSLLERAKENGLSGRLLQLFKDLKTTDFEQVMRALSSAQSVIRSYNKDSELINQLKCDHDELKDLLAETLAANHPDNPGEIEEAEYINCRRFLGNFSKVYSLNYDLLLYWTIMSDVEKMRSDDGFRISEIEYTTGVEVDYVAWSPANSHEANLHFLHGALHVFDSPTEVKKITWNRTQIPLVEQIRSALRAGYFPIFVSEGTSEQKLARIRHIDYLAKAYRSFQSIGNTLFIYGHSLSDSDNHILELIERGNLRNVFVGIFGDPDSEVNKKIIQRANAMPLARRSRRYALKVHFYDSATARVWR